VYTVRGDPVAVLAPAVELDAAALEPLLDDAGLLALELLELELPQAASAIAATIARAMRDHRGLRLDAPMLRCDGTTKPPDLSAACTGPGIPMTAR
jgi:hypothetical protein